MLPPEAILMSVTCVALVDCNRVSSTRWGGELSVCPWSVLSLEAMWMSVISVATRNHVDVHALCCCGL